MHSVVDSSPRYLKRLFDSARWIFADKWFRIIDVVAGMSLETDFRGSSDLCDDVKLRVNNLCRPICIITEERGGGIHVLRLPCFITVQTHCDDLRMIRDMKRELEGSNEYGRI